MLIRRTSGLYCPRGDFYIDPSRAVDHAVITHAHSDHARRGSRRYYCVHSGVGLLKERLGKNISVQSFHYREKFQLNGVELSFHPAGHILGSSQVRIDGGDEIWLASGDYKRDFDPTCESFEVVPCDVFVTEATFGTPSFVWPKNVNLGLQIYEWWKENAQQGFNSVLFAYSLGKAQRVLGALRPYVEKPIYCHAAASGLNQCYRDQGIALAETRCLGKVNSQDVLQGELFLVPQSFLQSEQAQILGDKYKTAFASGWTAQSTYGIDKGFVMSDHADWNDLVQTVQETGAKKVYVQHRGHGALVRHLKSLGIAAYSEEALIPRSQDQMSLF